MARQVNASWKIVVFLTLFGLGGSGCAPAAVLYQLALWAGKFLVTTVAAKTIERALDELFLPSKPDGGGAADDQPAIEVDRFDRLRGTYRGQLRLVEEKTGKMCILDSPRMHRETETSPWRIHKDYLEQVRDTLRK